MPAAGAAAPASRAIPAAPLPRLGRLGPATLRRSGTGSSGAASASQLWAATDHPIRR